MTDSLFSPSDVASPPQGTVPLAERLRPQSLDDFVGQQALLALDEASLRTGSLILWGPPGTGKTTFARIIGSMAGDHFETLSAVLDGVADMRRLFKAAQDRFAQNQRTLVFIDEIHRFNKAQQDALLPAVETGVVRLIGATTENPSFALNAALLSRVQILTLTLLDKEALSAILTRAEAHLAAPLPLDDGARAALIDMADGDGRYLLNMVEKIASQPATDQPVMAAGDLASFLSKKALNYDKSGDEHYNLISALHKSLRASDCDGALYWLARMLSAGEDPRYIARRCLRFASEDIGLADPNALSHTLAAWQSYERLGSPEGDLALVQAVIYLASAPKSNAVYRAASAATSLAKQTGAVPPPNHLINAPTKMMKEMGFGKGYQYDHDAADGFSGQNCFPDAVPRQSLYHPKEVGFERDIIKRLAYWQKLRDNK
ncbi:MAG: replication-associated recombination protein A [Candidatus Puniceispirillaceae bacterium]